MNFDQAVAALKDFELHDLYTFGARHEKAILEQVMIIGSAGAKDIAKDLLTNDFDYPDSFYMVAMLQSDADLQVLIDGYGKRKVISFAKAWVQAFREVKREQDAKKAEEDEMPFTPKLQVVGEIVEVERKKNGKQGESRFFVSLDDACRYIDRKVARYVRIGYELKSKKIDGALLERVRQDLPTTTLHLSTKDHCLHTHA
ncbi:hypothetical protein LC147_11865 [Vibrio harveyi]|uniref:hypothetical protein n=1 Tax=Vibrio harveyi TaxID=669 RepID=UPI003BB59246